MIHSLLLFKLLMKFKTMKNLKTKYNPHLPNEHHRSERWSRGIIYINKKKFDRNKLKKNDPTKTKESDDND